MTSPASMLSLSYRKRKPPERLGGASLDRLTRWGDCSRGGAAGGRGQPVVEGGRLREWVGGRGAGMTAHLAGCNQTAFPPSVPDSQFSASPSRCRCRGSPPATARQLQALRRRQRRRHPAGTARTRRCARCSAPRRGSGRRPASCACPASGPPRPRHTCRQADRRRQAGDGRSCSRSRSRRVRGWRSFSGEGQASLPPASRRHPHQPGCCC